MCSFWGAPTNGVLRSRGLQSCKGSAERRDPPQTSMSPPAGPQEPPAATPGRTDPTLSPAAAVPARLAGAQAAAPWCQVGCVLRQRRPPAKFSGGRSRRHGAGRRWDAGAVAPLLPRTWLHGPVPPCGYGAVCALHVQGVQGGAMQFVLHGGACTGGSGMCNARVCTVVHVWGGSGVSNLSCIVFAQEAWGVQHILHSGACTGDLGRAVQPFAQWCVHGGLWGVHGEDLTAEAWCGGPDKRQHSLHHPPESAGVVPQKKQSQASHCGCPEQLYCGGDPGGSAGGPAHLPPPQHVEVQVVDGLGAVLPVVDHCRERDRGSVWGWCHPWGGTGEGTTPPTHPAGIRPPAPPPSPCAPPPPSGAPGAAGRGAGGSALRVPRPHSCPQAPTHLGILRFHAAQPRDGALGDHQEVHGRLGGHVAEDQALRGGGAAP